LTCRHDIQFFDRVKMKNHPIVIFPSGINDESM